MKKRIILTFITIGCIVFFTNKLGRLIEDKTIDYVSDEVEKISKIIIRDIINDLDDDLLSDLYIVERNSNDEIVLIDVDTRKINYILGIINNTLNRRIKDFDKGNNDLLVDDSNIFKKYIVNGNKGVYLNIPLGIVINNPILMSVGPRLPVKLLLSGQVDSDLDTKIKQYGINNVMLEINAKLVINEQIILPFSSKKIEVEYKIPLVIELISGKVPENYLN